MQTFEQQKEKIARLNLIDDGFFQKVMQNKEVCEEVLRVLLQMPDLKVISNQIERTIPILTAKSVRLDLICKDENGNIINVEVQKANDTNHQKRVRYNMACLDTLSVEKGLNYHELPDLYVVFISAFDMFDEQETVYHVQRTIKKSGTYIENGTHEIYVNTKIDDGSDIARLMQYFKHSTGMHPLFQKLSSQVYYYKETPKGVHDMVDVWEEYANERAAEELKKAAIFLLKEGIDANIVAQAHKLPMETVLQLQKEIQLENA